MEEPGLRILEQLSTWPVPMPPSHHGIVWEDLTGEHLHALSTLFARMEARDNPPYRTSPGEVEEMLSPTRHWKGIAGFATKGIARGRMVAFSQVSVRFPGRIECLCQGGVDPDFRRIGLGGSLVDWQVAAAHELIDSQEMRGNAPSAHIVSFVESWQDELEASLLAHGFHWSQTSYELRADLARVPSVPDLGAYMSVEQWSETWDDEIRQAANRISEKEWGRPPLTEEQWQMGRTAFVPDWSFVAVDRHGDRPRIAGFLMASRYEQDWGVLGWKEGTIDQLGVGEEWRHLHVVDALVAASMAAQKADGMQHVSAGLGTSTRTGALAVYEYLGFQVVGQTRLYAIDLPTLMD